MRLARQVQRAVGRPGKVLGVRVPTSLQLRPLAVAGGSGWWTWSCPAWAAPASVAAGAAVWAACHAEDATVRCDAGSNDRTSVADIVEKAMPCTVRVQGISRSTASSGSGFFVSPDGIAVTNHHVVEPYLHRGGLLSLHLADDTVVAAKVLAYDKKADICLLKVTDGGGRRFPHLSPGQASQLRLGDQLVVLGCPLGGQLSVSTGVLSSRLFFADDNTVDPRFVFRGRQDWSLLQVDASILQGNSGGPVVDSRGDVVGISVMVKSGGGLGSLGYAISMDQAWPIVQQLLEQGYVARGRVGMRIRDQHDALPPKVSVGLQVVGVMPGSPAEKAGFQSGDVISTINGAPASRKGVYFDALGPVYKPETVLRCEVHRPVITTRGGAPSSWTVHNLHLRPVPDVLPGGRR